MSKQNIHVPRHTIIVNTPKFNTMNAWRHGINDTTWFITWGKQLWKVTLVIYEDVPEVARTPQRFAIRCRLPDMPQCLKALRRREIQHHYSFELSFTICCSLNTPTTMKVKGKVTELVGRVIRPILPSRVRSYMNVYSPAWTSYNSLSLAPALVRLCCFQTGGGLHMFDSKL